jgi:hypothetical protein
MKKTKWMLVSLLGVILSIGCQQKTYIKEMISDQKVSITWNHHFKTRDSMLVLLVPIEFQTNLNSTDVESFLPQYILNDKLATTLDDYILINNKTRKFIFDYDNTHHEIFFKSITLMNRWIVISKSRAEELIKKYNPNEYLGKIKSKKDTISLISYNKFRKENPEFLKEMRKETDSLILAIKPVKGKTEIIKTKINW